MIVIPAIDVRDGACVQLVGGDYAAELHREPDPLAALRRFERAGFSCVHVVDLDAATERGTNRAQLRAILSHAVGEVQIGGGLRDAAAVREWLQCGAARVVAGTRALEDPAFLAQMAQEFPGRVIVAVDVRNGDVVAGGWLRSLAASVESTLAALRPYALAGVLVTAVHREGRLQGPDLDLTAGVVRAWPGAVFAAGGIATMEDLRALADIGVSGAIVGMALYTGALDARAVAREFAA